MAIHSAKGKHGTTRLSILAACVIAALFLAQCGGSDAVVFVQEPLPYNQSDLVPIMGAGTLEVHYGKHYAGYVKKTNQLIKEHGADGDTVEAVIRNAAEEEDKTALFNNAAQAYNHAFFFKCLKPQGGGTPEGMLGEMIEETFGSYAEFKSVFLAAAKDQFGSGWVWLVLEGDELAVVATDNADTPIAHDLIPLFTVDVWEHAYYLDYQNRRADYVNAVLDKLINWEFALHNAG